MSRPVLWYWKAVNASGRVCRSTSYMTDKQQLKIFLKHQDLQLVSSYRGIFIPAPFASAKEKSRLFKQIAILLEAGIVLSDALVIIAEQYTQPAESALLAHIATSLHQGVYFSQALRGWPAVFSPLIVSLVETGEMTGQLAECCHHLANHQQQRDAMRKKMAKALRYPLFILLLTLLIASGMLMVIIPTFGEFYRSANVELPIFTQRLIRLSDWLKQHGPLHVMALIGMLLILKCFLPPWLQQIFQRFALTLPIVGSLKRGQVLSQIYSILAMSVQAGIPLMQGLDAAQQSLNTGLWKKQVQAIQYALSQGIPLWQSLGQSGCFTPLCQQMIRIGEESGRLDIMLTHLAHWHNQHTLDSAESFTAWLEPVMIIFLGGMIGLLILALYLPLFQLGETLL